MADDPRVVFLAAATWHGTLDEAEAILAAHPAIAGADIHTAAVLGDDAAVRRFLAEDPATVTATSAPYGGDALVYLCLSKYLRLDRARTPTASCGPPRRCSTRAWTPTPDSGPPARTLSARPRCAGPRASPSTRN